MQTALLNNRGLRAPHSRSLAFRGRSGAGRSNPLFARKTQGSALEIERAVRLSGAPDRPLTRSSETRRFEQTQRLVTQEMLALATDNCKATTAPPI